MRETVSQNTLNQLVIVGGGPAGWICAAAFSRLIGKAIEIELVESDAIGPVDVREATIAQFTRLDTTLGLDERDFVKKTHGTFKQSTRYVD